ncbi:MAG: response regulator [Proteobacteria bacterium]|nr:response regulator [Pseudomonadota bacterium]
MKGRVLLVDDAKDFIDYTKKRLLARDMDVLSAYNGREALDILRTESVDVVVLDVLMPDMEGIETLREIKKLRADQEVIILTGHGTIETAKEGMELGASEFLLKPCNLDKLLESIERSYAKSTNL